MIPQTSLKDPPPISSHHNHNRNHIEKKHNGKFTLQAYHTAHLEAIKGFGMHGYEIDFEVLVQEYQVSDAMLMKVVKNGDDNLDAYQQS